MTVAQLQTNFSGIQWKEYINNMLDGAEKVSDNDVILLGVPKYINNLQELLHITPKRYVKNLQ